MVFLSTLLFRRYYVGLQIFFFFFPFLREGMQTFNHCGLGLIMNNHTLLFCPKQIDDGTVKVGEIHPFPQNLIRAKVRTFFYFFLFSFIYYFFFLPLTRERKRHFLKKNQKQKQEKKNKNKTKLVR